jgi:hypothetical protein
MGQRLLEMTEAQAQAVLELLGYPHLEVDSDDLGMRQASRLAAIVAVAQLRVAEVIEEYPELVKAVYHQVRSGLGNGGCLCGGSHG